MSDSDRRAIGTAMADGMPCATLLLPHAALTRLLNRERPVQRDDHALDTLRGEGFKPAPQRRVVVVVREAGQRRQDAERRVGIHPPRVRGAREDERQPAAVHDNVAGPRRREVGDRLRDDGWRAVARSPRRELVEQRDAHRDMIPFPQPTACADHIDRWPALRSVELSQQQRVRKRRY